MKNYLKLFESMTILVQIFSLTMLYFSYSYMNTHPEAVTLASQGFLTTGILGVMVGGALTLQHRRIVVLEEKIKQLARA